MMLGHTVVTILDLTLEMFYYYAVKKEKQQK